MKIRIFRSGKGDCLLISGNKGGKILVDGGVSAAYDKYIAAELAKEKVIDLACISHIDDDHIGGFLKMIEDLVAWRAYDYQVNNGNAKAKKPKVPRPPQSLKQIWHNAFHDVVKDNNGEIESMLAASANILTASANPIIRNEGEITLSKAQAVQLSRRLKPEQLNIPLNASFKKKFAMYRKGGKPFRFGSLGVLVIAPFEADLDKLREEWNEWIKKSKAQITAVKKKVDKDSGQLSTSATPALEYRKAIATEWEPLILKELDIKGGLEAAVKKLGVREKVTTPNLASIMFLLQEGKKTVLMTGDGHWEDILKGLEASGKLKKNGTLHVDVLKVQHHGSEHNWSPDFGKRITASNYIFCGNGEHENPDLDVLAALIGSRTKGHEYYSDSPKAKDDYTIWLNCNAKEAEAKGRPHMVKVEKLLNGKQPKNLSVKFMPVGKNYLEFEV